MLCQISTRDKALFVIIEALGVVPVAALFVRVVERATHVGEDELGLPRI